MKVTYCDKCGEPSDKYFSVTVFNRHAYLGKNTVQIELCEKCGRSLLNEFTWFGAFNKFFDEPEQVEYTDEQCGRNK